MEDTSRDREEEEERLPEEERPSRRRGGREEILPEYSSYKDYSESIYRDMDKILSSDYNKKGGSSGYNIHAGKREVKNVRRYILDKIVDGIPAKFNSSTSSSDVFKETKLEKDRKNRRSSIVFVRYKSRIACNFDIARDYQGENRLQIVNKEAYDELEKDLKKEITEFKKDTFSGQVTEQLENINTRSINRPIEREDQSSFAYQPSYRDVEDTQNETIERMRVEFEKSKIELEQRLRSEEARRARADDDKERVIRYNRETILDFERQIKEKK